MARGKTLVEKKEALSKMIEAFINGKEEEAAVALHGYLKQKTQEILVGESEDCDDEDKKEEKSEDKDDSDDEDKEDKKEDKSDDKEDESEDKDDKEEVKEAVTHHPDGSFSRKPKGTLKFSTNGKAKARKHGNSAPHLDDDKVGDTKFSTNGKAKARKHGNSAPHLDDKVKGNSYKK